MNLSHFSLIKFAALAVTSAALIACGGGGTAAEQDAAIALQAGSAASTSVDAPGAPGYCLTGISNTSDAELVAFGKSVSRALRAFPSSYGINVCVYRESQAFVGGSQGSLVATLDAENHQNLLTQPHPLSTDVQCAPSGDIPCTRARKVQLMVPGTHPESVRLPSDPTNPMARVVAIVRDADTSGAQ
jgi:hypothetical protein